MGTSIAFIYTECLSNNMAAYNLVMILLYQDILDYLKIL